MAASPLGVVENPLIKMGTGYGSATGDKGVTYFLSNVIKFVTVGAGLFAFINLIIAGFTYISAGQDAKKTAEAWAKIYMSLIGLVVVIASYAIAALVGQIFFGDPGAILSPTIYGPGGK